jgi:hypothetical protein
VAVETGVAAARADAATARDRAEEALRVATLALETAQRGNAMIHWVMTGVAELLGETRCLNLPAQPHIPEAAVPVYPRPPSPPRPGATQASSSRPPPPPPPPPPVAPLD